MPLLSHPHKLLEDHLLGVKRLAQHLLGDRDSSLWDNNQLSGMLAIVCLAHDFGKATGYFQRYISSVEKNPHLQGGSLERHGLLSAVAGYYLARHCFGDHPEAEKLRFFVYLAIRRHHGNLKDIADEYADLSDDEVKLLLRQAASIDYDTLNSLWKMLKADLPASAAEMEPFSQGLLEGWIRGISAEMRSIRRPWRNLIIDLMMQAGRITSSSALLTNDIFNLREYFRFLFLYSLLIDADKHEAGLEHYRLAEGSLPADLVDGYKAGRGWERSGINLLREEAYQESAACLAERSSEHVFRLSLPTGLGKTLTAFNCAIKLRSQRGEESGVYPQIIYALPFLSIIDQNYKVMSDILLSGGQAGHHLLLKHHHLADPVYRLDKEPVEERGYSHHESKLLIEGWEAAIVVTTFIQFFETLMGWRNSNLRRFHRLVNSIIILDEIQTLPTRYWPLVELLLNYMTENTSSDIILVTATQPRIFASVNKAVDLVKPARYFQAMNRVRMEVDMTPRLLEEVAAMISGEILAQPDRKFLLIMNTINSARELFHILKKATSEDICYLSTAVAMKHRQERIGRIAAGECRLVVSTQLIEAGVDIDFDIVYRDLAPLDAINQAAGRCNRHAKSSGLVRVINLCKGNGRSLAALIYDNVALDVTRQLLETRNTIDEAEFLNLINTYFQTIETRVSFKEASELLQAATVMRFFSDDRDKKGVNHFRLIEEGESAGVFLELDDEATHIWHEYEDILEIEDFYAKEEKFCAIKSRLYEYVISVHRPDPGALPPKVYGFHFIGKPDLKRYYDKDTGFAVSDAAMIF
ncbi:MAG: CRISPR-associated helicase Cas3' [bacterium]|nr:CRISPR-associated helicase Cas3' [bacterium]